MDELLFFLELVEAVNPDYAGEIDELSKEGTKLLAIIVSSMTTLRAKQAAK